MASTEKVAEGDYEHFLSTPLGHVFVFLAFAFSILYIRLMWIDFWNKLYKCGLWMCCISTDDDEENDDEEEGDKDETIHSSTSIDSSTNSQTPIVNSSTSSTPRDVEMGRKIGKYLPQQSRQKHIQNYQPGNSEGEGGYYNETDSYGNERNDYVFDQSHYEHSDSYQYGDGVNDEYHHEGDIHNEGYYDQHDDTYEEEYYPEEQYVNSDQNYDMTYNEPHAYDNNYDNGEKYSGPPAPQRQHHISNAHPHSERMPMPVSSRRKQSNDSTQEQFERKDSYNPYKSTRQGRLHPSRMN